MGHVFRALQCPSEVLCEGLRRRKERCCGGGHVKRSQRMEFLCACVPYVARVSFPLADSCKSSPIALYVMVSGAEQCCPRRAHVEALLPLCQVPWCSCRCPGLLLGCLSGGMVLIPWMVAVCLVQERTCERYSVHTKYNECYACMSMFNTGSLCMFLRRVTPLAPCGERASERASQ